MVEPIKENNEELFPEESSLIIREILEKHSLKQVQEDGIEKFFNLKTSEERKKIFDDLPGSKIAQLVREFYLGEIGLEELPLALEKRLNISKEKANEITKDLKEKLFIISGPIKKERGETMDKFPPIIEKEKIKKEGGKDIYRESLE